MKITPVGNKVVVKTDNASEQVRESGIIIDNIKEQNKYTGEVMESNISYIKKGMYIFFESGIPVQDNIIIVKEDHILGIDNEK